MTTLSPALCHPIPAPEGTAGRGRVSVADLTKLPGVWRGGELEHAAQPVVATGHAALDRELPGGGWPTGTLSEVLHDGVGIGEVSFLAGALAKGDAGERLIALINPPHLPYAPAIHQSDIPLHRCLVIRPRDKEDALWASEQVLRSGACSAALLWVAQDDYAWLRRLQMAAEAGRAMAILFRSTAAERLSTPAHLRVVLSREEGALRLRIPKRRGPPLVTPIALTLGGRPWKQPARKAPCSGSPSSSPHSLSRSSSAQASPVSLS